MKNTSVFKTIITIAIIVLSQASVVTQTAKLYKNNIFDSFDVVDNAREGIKDTLNTDDHNPYFIRRTYDIYNGKVSITTKTHYKEYRKKPSYDKQTFYTGSSIIVDGVNVEGTIEFIYKSSDKNRITQINKKIKPCSGIKNKKIALNANQPSMLIKT